MRITPCQVRDFLTFWAGINPLSAPFSQNLAPTNPHFLTFMTETATSGGPGPGFLPTVKRVIFPGSEGRKSKDQQ